MSAITVVLLMGCAKPPAATAVPEDYPFSRSYLPKELSHVSLGMDHDDFTRVFQHIPGKPRPGADFYEVAESFDGAAFQKAIYHIDLDGKQPLYEILLEFPEGYEAVNYARKQYGAENFENEWRFNTGDGFFVMVRANKNELIYGATLPQTSYAKYMKPAEKE